MPLNTHHVDGFYITRICPHLHHFIQVAVLALARQLLSLDDVHLKEHDNQDQRGDKKRPPGWWNVQYCCQ